VLLAPLLHLYHIVSARWRLDFERVGRQFDLHAVGAELGDGAGVTLLTRHGELEGIDARQALFAVGVTDKGDALEGNGIVEQFEVELGAMLLDPLQGFLAQPMVVPQPSACRGDQHQDEEILQGQHLRMLQTGRTSLTASLACRTGGNRVHTALRTILETALEISRMKRTPHLLAIQSHVVFGHAGNSAAVFPMQRIGVNVWPLNTVQFSNHTQYGQWAGDVLAPAQIPALVEGISNIGELGHCDAVLSGYLGSAEQGRAILAGVERIKGVNPKALYLCDPVMGHPEKGCIVPQEVSEFLLEEAAARADILCPNQLELDSFCGRRAQSLEDCVQMARSLLARGPRVVLVKHLAYPGRAEDQFEMLLVTAEDSWHLRRPLLAFPRQPVGVGDLTSGLFLARVLLGDTWLQAFEFTASAVHEVLLETQACASYELQLVRAQDRIAHPRVRFEAQRLAL